MKKIMITILTAGFLSSCATASQPKQPSEANRQPVNKTLPIEIQRGAQ